MICRKVWMAKGAVPSEAGRRSGVDLKRRTGFTSARLSTRCAQMICSVVVMRRASSGSGNSTSGCRARAAATSRRPTSKIPPPLRISSSFTVRGTGRVLLPLRDVSERARLHVEFQRVAVSRVGHRLGALHDVEAEIERVPPEDVAHVGAADDDHLEPRFLGDSLESRGRHLAEEPMAKRSAGDEERLPRVDAGAEVGHDVAEGARLPALVERGERLGRRNPRRE